MSPRGKRRAQISRRLAPSHRSWLTSLLVAALCRLGAHLFTYPCFPRALLAASGAAQVLVSTSVVVLLPRSENLDEKTPTEVVLLFWKYDLARVQQIRTAQPTTHRNRTHISLLKPRNPLPLVLKPAVAGKFLAGAEVLSGGVNSHFSGTSSGNNLLLGACEIDCQADDESHESRQRPTQIKFVHWRPADERLDHVGTPA
ncbi:hypothetical protein CEPID_09035 [Corynebacterium epidermidicanis]|uniref:Uncharacterized protein n=1 Tax=Corynebacterium epidermidicanis TaxID=1050174 RepID=A0A0G3GVX3_9CORY|nr:hypothetical protein CEPID_09035 [Corynebacterium epidermidicanis]